MKPFVLKDGNVVPIEKDSWEWAPKERILESWEETVGSIFGAGSAVLGALGYDKGKEWASSKAVDWFDKAASRQIDHTTWDEATSDPLEFGKWAAELVTSYLPDLALMFVGGAGAATTAGRLAAKQTGQKFVKSMAKGAYKRNYKELSEGIGKEWTKERLAKEAAKKSVRDTASLLGAASVEGAQSIGTFYLDDQEKRGEDANPYRALGVGLGVTAISMLSPITRGVAGGVVGKLPKRIELGKITLGEFAEEMGQEGWTMLNEAGADPNVTFGEMASSPEGRARLWESGVAGAVLGFTFGGGAKTAFRGRERVEQGPDIIDPDKARSTLESANIDTSQDTILERDIPGLGPKGPPSWTMEGQRAKLTRERDQARRIGMAEEIDTLGLEDNQIAEPIGSKVPLTEIMLDRTVLDPQGNEVQVQIAASELVKDQDTKIEKYYQLRECLLS